MAIDLNRLKEKYNQLKEASSRSGGNLNFWKPNKVGTYIIRILPPWDQKKAIYFRDTAYHYDVGEEGRRFVCLRAEGQVCPICELRSQLYTSADPEVKAMAGQLAPTPKVFMNIIDRNHPELGVQIASLVGQRQIEQIHEAILGYCLDPAWGDLTDATYGRDITVERKGTGLDSEYQVRPSPNPTPLSSDVNIQNATLSQLKNLDTMVKITGVEEMSAAIADVAEIASRAGIPVAAPIGKPMPVTTNTPVATTSSIREFWIVDTKGEVVLVNEAEAKKCVQSSKADVVCMLNGEADWKTAAAYGIKYDAPKPPAPVAPLKPTPPPAPAKPAAPAKPTPPPAGNPAPAKAGGTTIPDELKQCFGMKYDAKKDDCQLCAYEAFCVTTMNK